MDNLTWWNRWWNGNSQRRMAIIVSLLTSSSTERNGHRYDSSKETETNCWGKHQKRICLHVDMHSTPSRHSGDLDNWVASIWLTAQSFSRLEFISLRQCHCGWKFSQTLSICLDIQSLFAPWMSCLNLTPLRYIFIPISTQRDNAHWWGRQRTSVDVRRESQK